MSRNNLETPQFASVDTTEFVIGTFESNSSKDLQYLDPYVGKAVKRKTKAAFIASKVRGSLFLNGDTQRSRSHIRGYINYCLLLKHVFLFYIPPLRNLMVVYKMKFPFK